MKTTTITSAVAAIALSLAAAACGTSSTGTGDASPTPPTGAAATTDPVERPTEAVDELVTISSSRMHIRCAGHGDTTVLLIAGWVEGAENWTAIEPTLAERTRVCAYARFGTGTSDAPATTQTFETHATDLHTLLEAAGEPGPYVVVGHSFGGAEAVTFTSRYPHEVAGLMLIDASPANWPTTACSVRAWEPLCAVFHDPSLNAERLDVLRSFDAVATISSLGDLPMTVMTRAHFTDPALEPAELTRVDAAWAEGADRWAALSSDSAVVSVQDSGHHIQLDQPARVIDEVGTLLSSGTGAYQRSFWEHGAVRAIVQEAWGSDPEATLDLREIPRPTIGEDDVVVKVAAASVDRGTVHCLTGQPYAMRLAGFGVRRPKAPNPGRALAGVVDSVGTNVAGFEPGDEVYGTCPGSFSEYAIAQPGMLASKPANLSFEQAAAAPISGVTALQAVRKADVAPGTKVLVIGASGGVGTFAVQIAKALGAEVTGVCSTEKVDLVRSIGADHVLDYTRDKISDGGRRYDVILDIAGNRTLSELRRALTKRGTLVIVGGETGGRWLGGFDRSLRAVLLSPFVSQSLGMLTSKENTADLDELRELIETRGVIPTVDRTYPLLETAAAIRDVRDGSVRGKAVIAG